jgi:hypothetical protein
MDVPIDKLGKSSVMSELIKLLEKIPQGELQILLNELERRYSRPTRKHNRKAASSEVECVTGYQSSKGRIKNISAGGVFIETRMPFRYGSDIILRFIFHQNIQKQFRILGQIVRINPTGIAVRFEELSKEQEKFIKSQCEIL